MTKHFNKLTEAEAERLALLIEECGEVIQAATKILRHGYEATHPETGTPNREALASEVGHVRFAIQMMINADDIAAEIVNFSVRVKKRTIGRWLHHLLHHQGPAAE